ncbi:MAG TPA: exodeoxyribonuclease VII small subunit [Firmicutes bacterium]|nr:exodeoxyribonuclease VII small subunit [Bacillota bacterium]
MSTKKKELTFEDAFRRLEEIVEQLESGDLTLEQSLEKFEEGIKLSRICTEKLENAQKKIEVLMKDSDGKFSFEDLDSEKEETE